MASPPSIVWFRHNLRLEDNLALQAALKADKPVIPVFVWSPSDEGDWPPGAASAAWLRSSLASLNRDLRDRGSRLILLRGSEALIDLCRATGAKTVYCSRRYEPAARGHGTSLREELESADVQLETFDDGLLYAPGTVLNKAGDPYKVFTPFWRALQEHDDPGFHVPAPSAIPAPGSWPESLGVEELDLPPAPRELSLKGWSPGEPGALSALEAFFSRTDDYEDNRNRPDIEGTSRLSPHLRWGEISPGRIWREIKSREDSGDLSDGSPYLRQLAWREFSVNLLYFFPHTESRPLMEQFEKFPWKQDPEALETWKQGRTGFPIVDAGMRELLHTGWMHNRVRMIVASFLVKDLLVHWLEGARWFWDRLVDADLANNTMGWQWTSGCGADAAPYFRVFNPTGQEKKFDPEGEYVRRWVPELRVAAGGNASAGEYPEPMLDHAEARKRALEAYELVKSS